VSPDLFGYCQVCLALRETRPDGMLHVHQAWDAPCPGSGGPPLADERQAAQPPDVRPTAPRSHRPRVRDPGHCRRCYRPADPGLSEFLPWCSTRCRSAGRAALRTKAIARSREIDDTAGRAS
jgi:endogenous inhibitor of DNA gyrase (YacG/DUF329 family)